VEGGIRGVLLIREKQRRRDRKAGEGEKKGEEGAKELWGDCACVARGDSRPRPLTQTTKRSFSTNAVVQYVLLKPE